MDQSFLLPRLMSRERALDRIASTLRDLPSDKAWKVEVREAKSPRTLSQNALLWAIYGEILDKGGEAMAGWDKDDLHEFFLISHFGSEVRELFGKKRLVPLARSSKLSKMQFAEHVDYILRFMAEKGVYIDTQAAA
jgi:hypothetical protein